MIKWEPKHRYEEVADDLRDRILSGEFPPRETIPAIPRIMQQYSVGRNTAMHAVALLVEQGFLIIKRSKGTYVVPPEDRP
ncbi:GntR family transcriptional regulator [Nonomuraea phyllanthi]|uniref:GntR family transcriptional regulator n=1 Tax=Nonomuraea phyllanthi TaxID=2219224 RepID=A0A5C4V6L1_9ACTN|nr:winged helix-turn-helix domain-containing protein [Nonomuraea phyllanthi]KAB8186823.1 GntR family transcriptional regulator [Nonomuraea phyllanthi]